MFKLCLAGVGGAPHPDFLEQMLTGDQQTEWEAFDELEPVGSYKDDFRFAQLCDLIHVLAAASGGQRVQSKIMDFMPWWQTQYIKHLGGTAKKQSIEQMAQGLKEWARQHNRAEARKAKKQAEKGE